ncbi:MAG: carbonate dehydratase [Polyangiaceae bacterium]
MRNKLSKSYAELLEGNARFVEETTKRDPNFFEKLEKGQQPRALWIGCADSRVPANQITGTTPGEIFVHRNIANLVVHTDINMLSVLQYAVEVLEVPHIIVCGHYGCGGVAAALTRTDLGLINNWLRNIKDVYRLNEGELKLLDSREQIERRMVELNVIEQVHHLCQTSIVQNAWAKRTAPVVHGWVYDIADGRIRDLGVNYMSPESIHHIYRAEPEARPKAKLETG